MDKPSFRYYAEMALVPLAAAAAAWFDRAEWSLAWACVAALGLILFTFIEYWVHRTVLHRIMWHSTHQRHHTHPAEFVTFPVWFLPIIFAIPWFVLPTAAFVGFMVAATWFFWWHDAIHHWGLQKHPWIRAYERWHDLHHADLPVNYGITQPAWDLVFGTYMGRAAGEAAIKARRDLTRSERSAK